MSEIIKSKETVVAIYRGVGSQYESNGIVSNGSTLNESREIVPFSVSVFQNLITVKISSNRIMKSRNLTIK